jgi:glycosyltransferase involved in cell wall biosynthesis
MSRPRLSVCLTTYNMGAILPVVLDNVDAVADEIVVVDNFSTDATAEIVARHAKARLLQRPFPGSLGLNKNLSIDAATGDWVLIVDSDELLGDELRRRLPRLVASRFIDFYKLPRYWLSPTVAGHYVHSDKHYPDWQLRLFRNRPFFRYPADSGVHHHFPREGRGRGRKLAGCHLFHLDFLLLDRAQRERKVAERTRTDPRSRDVNQAFYLFEDRPHELRRCREPLSGVQLTELRPARTPA